MKFLPEKFKPKGNARPQLGWSLTVHFDQPKNEALSHLDYSPLPRITRQSLFMGVLVSMGGFLFVLRVISLCVH